MSNLRIFENPAFGRVRVLEKDGEPWFVAADVCRALGLEQVTRAMDRLDDDERGLLRVTHPQSTLKTLDVNGVNEPGLYHLVLCSLKPEAKAFKRWITHEVIPSIRKTGGYIAGQECMSDAELMAKALLVARRQIEERDRKLTEAAPKVLFADAVSASKTSILVGDMAKLLKQNGVDIGQKRLFRWMRENGWLIRQKGASWNMPTQRAMDMGLFVIKEAVITHSDGHISVNRTAKVTGKGQVFFINKFLRGVNESD